VALLRVERISGSTKFLRGGRATPFLSLQGVGRGRIRADPGSRPSRCSKPPESRQGLEAVGRRGQRARGGEQGLRDGPARSQPTKSWFFERISRPPTTGTRLLSSNCAPLPAGTPRGSAAGISPPPHDGLRLAIHACHNRGAEADHPAGPGSPPGSGFHDLTRAEGRRRSAPRAIDRRGGGAAPGPPRFFWRTGRLCAVALSIGRGARPGLL